ncbi:hypothetical protein CVT25_000860 [Psilocybe cyanescens]|uniref:FAR-17a/AIG1-like protein n=1 Tax=Psilocybe cyanescens TaxID=93625 RepID=A0A409VTH5_PSICY|nr:hypothetical protein CVT25_000860 [Psilocybe cyanescens]
MARLNIYSRLGVPSEQTFDAPHKFVTSPFFKYPISLSSLRIIISVYTLVTLLVTLIWNAVRLHDAQSYFSYFTYLAYIGLCAYYIASSTQTVAYALRWRRLGTGAGYPLQRWPRMLQALHVVLHSSVVSFPILVTIVFWALLSDSTTFESAFTTWSNLSVHAFNTAFALIEIFLTNSPPPPWLTLPITVLFLIGYMGVAYITHDTQGFYTYSFLDPKKQGAKLAAYIIGIAVAQIIIFSVVRGLMVLRQRWAQRNDRVLPDVPGPQNGSGGRPTVNIEDDWEEVESPTTPKKVEHV